MRFWDPADPAIAAADAEPWDGLLSGTVRPVSIRVLTRLYVAGTALAVQSGIAAVVMSYAAEEEIAHPIVLRILGVLLLGMSLVLPAGLAGLTASTFRRQAPLSGTAIVMSMGLASTVGIWSAGPEFAFAVVFYFEALPFAFYLFRLAWALLAAANAAVGCGLVLLLQDGWREPVLTWLLVVTTLVAMAWILGFLAERAEAMAESEHEARVELAEVNHTLEDRVANQVTEIERLGELRRFLTPQVADAVMSADAEAMTRPHRRRIAVFFCDLRGFTAFTRDSEPEDVIANLDQYYRTVGEVLQRHGATIGGYAGDGIMAYLGDPVPHPEPAKAAVQMVTELRGDLAALVAEWQHRGHDLSYGIGLSYGYATLGVVGFDGRFDYTPMGGVVNLAARLCDKAGAGQVLMDHATYAELDGVATCEPVDGLELKGLGSQRAYALT